MEVLRDVADEKEPSRKCVFNPGRAFFLITFFYVVAYYHLSRNTFQPLRCIEQCVFFFSVPSNQLYCYYLSDFLYNALSCQLACRSCSVQAFALTRCRGETAWSVPLPWKAREHACPPACSRAVVWERLSVCYAGVRSH